MFSQLLDASLSGKQWIYLLTANVTQSRLIPVQGTGYSTLNQDQLWGTTLVIHGVKVTMPGNDIQTQIVGEQFFFGFL